MLRSGSGCRSSAEREPIGPSLRRRLAAAGLALAASAPLAAQDPGPAGVLREKLKEQAEELDPRAWGVGERVPDLAFTDIEGRPGSSRTTPSAARW